jgi:hypothetical protein
MKIKTTDLIGPALDWAAAKAAGRVMCEPPVATDEDFSRLKVPFTAYSIGYRSEKWVVEKATIVRHDVLTHAGATAPSVTARYEDGGRAQSSAGMFYLTKEDAQLSADMENLGGVDGFTPSTDWSQGGPIIDRELIAVCLDEDGDTWRAWYPMRQGIEDGTGPTPLIAAMRCFVASKLGDTVEVPDEFFNQGEMK